jgi:hypothetical protein
MSHGYIYDEFALCRMNTYMMNLPYVSWRRHILLILLNMTQSVFYSYKFSAINHSLIPLMIVDFDIDLAKVLISTVTPTPCKFKKTGFKSLSKVNQSYVNPFGLTLG